MLNAVLQKEIETLPESALDEVVDFVHFLKAKFSENKNCASKKSMYGVWQGEHFYMADDFNEPLSDFAEYM